MAAIWMRLKAELRGRGRAWLGLAVLGLILPAATLVANIIATLPGRAAARTHPAVVLRTE